MYKPYLTTTSVLTIPCLGRVQTLLRTDSHKQNYIPCLGQRGQKPYPCSGISPYRPHKGESPPHPLGPKTPIDGFAALSSVFKQNGTISV